jgi:hypothetical protein
VVGAARRSRGKDAPPTFLIGDAQRVKTTDTAARKGSDAGKKVSGIKRHIGVDRRGLPQGLHVTTAHVSDKAGALAAFTRGKADLTRVQSNGIDVQPHRQFSWSPGGFGGR